MRNKKAKQLRRMAVAITGGHVPTSYTVLQHRHKPGVTSIRLGDCTRAIYQTLKRLERMSHDPRST